MLFSANYIVDLKIKIIEFGLIKFMNSKISDETNDTLDSSERRIFRVLISRRGR